VISVVLNRCIHLKGPGKELVDHLKKSLTLPNPVYLENEKRGRWNKGVPKSLEFYQETDQGLEIPRGCMRQLITTLKGFDLPFELVDRRRLLPEVDFQFSGELKPYQEKACQAILKKHFAVLTAPTGSGKTVMMLSIVARRKQPTLIVVHTRELAAQWSSRIETFLGIPPEDQGFIGGGRFRLGDKITVAMVQTLYKHTMDVSHRIGNLVVDECHRAPSRTFQEAVAAFDSYYMTGLSATPFRRDRLSKLIFWFLGDRAHDVDQNELQHRGDILKAQVVFRPTDFNSPTDPTSQYVQLMSELINDMDRNRLIAADIARESAGRNGVTLVLSDRKSHCRTLRDLLKNEHGLEADLLTGDLKEQERRDVLSRLEDNRISILIATSQLLGEGFDSDRLTDLFLVYPIRFKGRLLQYLGRILRPSQGKTARVFDYVDVNIGVLEAAARARHSVYTSSGS